MRFQAGHQAYQAQPIPVELDSDSLQESDRIFRDRNFNQARADRRVQTESCREHDYP